MANSTRWACTAAASPRCSGTSSCSHVPSGAALVLEGGLALTLQRRGALLVSLELREPCATSSRYAITSARVSPYLRHSSRSACRRARTDRELFGILVDRLTTMTDLARDVVEFLQQGAQTVRVGGERATGPERCHRCPDGVDPAPPSSTSAGDGLDGGLTVGRPRPRAVLASLEIGLLVGVAEPRPRPVLRAGIAGGRSQRPGPGVTAEGGERGVDLGQSRRAHAAAGGRSRRTGSEGGALGGGTQQALVRVLTVEVDRGGAELGQRGETVASRPLDVRPPRPSVGGDDTAEDDLLLTVQEPTLDPGLRRPGADPRPVGATATRRLIASTSMVLPAPVSPVRTVRPAPRTMSCRSMTPRSSCAVP